MTVYVLDKGLNKIVFFLVGIPAQDALIRLAEINYVTTAEAPRVGFPRIISKSLTHP